MSSVDIYHIQDEIGESIGFYSRRKDALKWMSVAGAHGWSLTRFTLPVTKGGLLTALRLAGTLGGSEVEVVQRLDADTHKHIADPCWERETDYWENLVEEGEIE